MTEGRELTGVFGCLVVAVQFGNLGQKGCFKAQSEVFGNASDWGMNICRILSQ
jgi:hypothetical protein